MDSKLKPCDHCGRSEEWIKDICGKIAYFECHACGYISSSEILHKIVGLYKNTYVTEYCIFFRKLKNIGLNHGVSGDC